MSVSWWKETKGGRGGGGGFVGLRIDWCQIGGVEDNEAGMSWKLAAGMWAQLPSVLYGKGNL